MAIEQIIECLEEQARELDILSGGDPNSSFTHKADALIAAANLLRTQIRNG